MLSLKENLGSLNRKNNQCQQVMDRMRVDINRILNVYDKFELSSNIVRQFKLWLWVFGEYWLCFRDFLDWKIAYDEFCKRFTDLWYAQKDLEDCMKIKTIYDENKKRDIPVNYLPWNIS